MQAHFRNAGYTTAAFGKRHLYEPCDRGWDHTASHLLGESPGAEYDSWVSAAGFGREAALDWAAELGTAQDGSLINGQADRFALLATRASALPPHMTMEAFTAERTKAFLRDCAASNQPFFCWSSFYRPHQPYTPLPSYWARHDRSEWGAGTNHGSAIAMPETLRTDPAEVPPYLRAWCEGTNRVWRIDLARANEQLYRDYVSAYYALVEEVDAHCGDILALLDELGLARDTIVIYASDHGDFAGAHGMVEKCSAGHNVYEDTLRVPLILRLPDRIQQGVERSDLVELVDLYPTLVDLCDLEQPPHALEGRSLAGTLENGSAVGREYCVSENWVQSTVITDRYKLGRWREPVDPSLHFDFREFGDMLYDRIEDPLETNNIIGDAPGIRADLERKLAAWEAEHPLNLPDVPEVTRKRFEANVVNWLDWQSSRNKT
jgi:arylsulfatase A-like enzyme